MGNLNWTSGCAHTILSFCSIDRFSRISYSSIVLFKVHFGLFLIIIDSQHVSHPFRLWDCSFCCLSNWNSCCVICCTCRATVLVNETFTFNYINFVWPTYCLLLVAFLVALPLLTFFSVSKFTRIRFLSDWLDVIQSWLQKRTMRCIHIARSR